MNILVTGNTGYVGSRIGRILRSTAGKLTGFDAGFFSHCLTTTELGPDIAYDRQIWCDLRRLDARLLEGVDAVVHLAAISNDPMGRTFEAVTDGINSQASRAFAAAAKEAGVRRFVFASSCSLYGAAEGPPRVETDALNPLTAYARSKAVMEGVLADLADDRFQTTCLRFPTACGMSPRLRLDLVLNDFVASALTTGTIEILSDGTPWRPLIDVADMGRSISWALARNGESSVRVNVGRNEWNYQIAQVAEAVAARLPGTKVRVSPDAAPDKRSYRVDFRLFESLAPDHLPQVPLEQSIDEVAAGLRAIDFQDASFRTSRLIRLVALQKLRDADHLDADLCWRR
jgi:nucleoside-diphosphate-sugar epimerase